jgi:hypothetical protein
MNENEKDAVFERFVEVSDLNAGFSDLLIR